MSSSGFDPEYWQQVVVRAVADRIKSGVPMSISDRAVVELLVGKCWPARPLAIGGLVDPGRLTMVGERP